MKSRLIITLFIAILVWLAPAAARTYRWVDENGTTIYSQSPPPDGKATIIKTPPPSHQSGDPNETMKKLKARLDAIEEAKKQKEETKKEEGKAADIAKNKKRNCANARKNLETIEQHGRIKMKMADGSYKALTEEERQAEIDNAKKAIERYCK